MSRWSTAPMRSGSRRVGGLDFANLASHHWMLGMFDSGPRPGLGQGCQRPDRVILIFPAGRARKVDGGYVLQRKLAVLVRVDSSEWNMLASVVHPNDEADGSSIASFLVNRNDYKILDTWNATGLREQESTMSK